MNGSDNVLPSGGQSRETELEERLAALLERESARASELAYALESAAAVAGERDTLNSKLDQQQELINELRSSLKEAKKNQLLRQGDNEQSFTKNNERVQSKSISSDLSSLQEHISMQNSELMNILRHLANSPLPLPETHQESLEIKNSNHYITTDVHKNDNDMKIVHCTKIERQAQDTLKFEAKFSFLISEIGKMYSHISSENNEVEKSLGPRLLALKKALQNLYQECKDDKQASDLRHQLDTTNSVSDEVKQLMVNSLRSSSKGIDGRTMSESKNTNTEMMAASDNEKDELLKWRKHSEEVMDAMRTELSEAISQNIELERKNIELEDDKRSLHLRLDESHGRTKLLETAVSGLKARRQESLVDNSYKEEVERKMCYMQKRFDLLKEKYVKQSRRTRELQVRMLQFAESSHNSGDLDVEEIETQAEMFSQSNGYPLALQSEENRLRNHSTHEKVPSDVLQRIESLQGTRSRLYTAPSSQNRRPLPPEIPVPEEVLEAQRLTDQHRTALKSAPSSQLLKLIKHMDSWHESLSEEEQERVRPVTAPTEIVKLKEINKETPHVFVPVPKRNNFVSSKSVSQHSRSRPKSHDVRQKKFHAKRSSTHPRRIISARPRVMSNRPTTHLRKRPLSAREPSSKDALQLVTVSTDSEQNHQFTIPVTPDFAILKDCNNRTSCACHPDRGERKKMIDSSKSFQEKTFIPWK